MKRPALLACALSLVAVGCGSSSTAPTTPANSNIIFTAQLMPANETPPIANAENTSSGTVTITFVPTKDAAGNITSAVGTANVTMQGFPAGSTITLAHIHTGAAGVAGPVFIGFVPAASLAPVNGAASFSQTSNATGDQMTSMINNPAGFYFNVHTTQNPGGVMRGQLVRTQ
jgi:hypothetical protein